MIPIVDRTEISSIPRLFHRRGMFVLRDRLVLFPRSCDLIRDPRIH
jgi:hypothetical protein